LHAQGQLLSKPKIPPLLITKTGEENARSFDTPEVMIGRSPNSAYPIPNDTVSARHARLSYHHNQWWVEDLNSTNGTYLNDERLTFPTVIVSGDELRCGKVSLMVRIED
jgi:pSer/pThr/pTyr-binding forkhead associated (FHA) protein